MFEVITQPRSTFSNPTTETPTQKMPEISEICSKITIKTPKRRYWHHSIEFIVNFEQISHISLEIQLLTLNNQIPAG